MSKEAKVAKAVEKNDEATLIKLATGKKKELQLLAIDGLGKIARDDGYNNMATLLRESSDPEIRAACAVALGINGNQRARAHMMNRLEKETDATVIAAIHKGLAYLENVK